MAEPITAEQYLARLRKTVKCPKCDSVFEIQKVRVSEVYKKFFELREGLPDLDEIKGLSNDELAKHPLMLSTLGIMLMVGSYRPKIDVAVDLERNVLSVGSLDECCLEYVTKEIIDWSGMSQKAESARRMFSLTEPAKTVGMGALLTNERPSKIMDPQGTVFTDFEAAALDCSMVTSVKKDIQVFGAKSTDLDREIEAKYEEWNSKMSLWS